MSEEPKEETQLTEYLKEKGISLEDVKTMIEESIKELEPEIVEEEEEIEVEPTEEPKPEPEIPTFTKEDVKELIAEEVKKSLKIKRKVPSKGKIRKIDKTEPKRSRTVREFLGPEWKEELV